jgi:ribonucleoside-diphosphate reductase subunit M2
MPGLTFSNELISRDEGLHTDFACLMYKHMRHKLEQHTVQEIVREAVELERQFCCEALSVALVRGAGAGGWHQP